MQLLEALAAHLFEHTERNDILIHSDGQSSTKNDDKEDDNHLSGIMNIKAKAAKTIEMGMISTMKTMTTRITLSTKIIGPSSTIMIRVR